MLFHTLRFFAFFLVVFLGWMGLRKTRFSMLWWWLVSLFFYGSWSWLFVPLLVSTAFVDHRMSQFLRKTPHVLTLLGTWAVPLLAIFLVAHNGWPTPSGWWAWATLSLLPVAGQWVLRGSSQRGKLYLACSVCFDVGMLAYFKYAGFLTVSANTVLGWMGTSMTVPVLDVLLPVGISFFVFRSMSYVMDVYRGATTVVDRFVDYAAYVSFFPQLLAGPIERKDHLLSQLKQTAAFSMANLSSGIEVFILGLFKKVALADALALFVGTAYGNPEAHSGAHLLAATFAFAWQVYFDFSGYTDMARGLAKVFGIELALNFNAPYTATGLRDFWRRWHITLSKWFQDYVYIPLGGKKGSQFAVLRNMSITLLVSGLWHGAAWTFVLWGAWHALGRCLTLRLESSAVYERIPKLLRQLGIFAFVCLGWTFFRASSMESVWLVLSRMFTWAEGTQSIPVWLLGAVVVIWIYQLLLPSRVRPVLESAPVRIAVVSGMLVYLFVFAGSGKEQFIYFQF